MSPLLEVGDLAIKYHTRDGILTAIRDVSFEVNPGEIVGVVGESGCGKSTVATTVMRLLPPNGEIAAGRMLFEGRDLVQLNEEEMRKLRGKEISMIFQDPMTSLNPFFSVETQMLDALPRTPVDGEREASRDDLAIEMLNRVGIPDPEVRIKDYPHQFSGGMRQRIMVAIALVTRPAARRRRADLGAGRDPRSADRRPDPRPAERAGHRGALHHARSGCRGAALRPGDRDVRGQHRRGGRCLQHVRNAQHPYTQALLRSHPSRSARRSRLVTIPGRVPSLRDLPPGCKFAPRCHRAEEICLTTEPPAVQLATQTVLCHSCSRRVGAPVRA